MEKAKFQLEASVSHFLMKFSQTFISFISQLKYFIRYRGNIIEIWEITLKQQV